MLKTFCETYSLVLLSLRNVYISHTQAFFIYAYMKQDPFIVIIYKYKYNKTEYSHHSVPGDNLSKYKKRYKKQVDNQKTMI